MNALLAPPKKSLGKIGNIHAYLERCGGRDILRFDTQTESTNCARMLRERFPDIKVAASYDRVEIKL